MNKKEFAEILTRVGLSVLEQHAFLFPDSPETLPDELIKATDFSDYATIEMRVSGDLNGCFSVYLSESLCFEIESNISGADPAAEGDTDGDAAKEVLNILGANVLDEYLGPDAKYEIGIPDYRVGDLATKELLLKSDIKTVFNVDGQPVVLRFQEDVEA